MSNDAGEDTAYEALLAKVDQSDFGGAWRSVFLDDAIRHPLHVAKAGLDLSAAQAELHGAHSAGERLSRLRLATTALRTGHGRRTQRSERWLKAI